MKDITLSARLALVDRNPDSQEAKMTHARRRLNFGDEDDANDDHQPARAELEQQYEEERARYLEEKKKKWNFDFETEKPLEGTWQWEPVHKPSENRIGTVAPESADAPADRPQGDAADQAP